jgi:hypothetical protein
VPREAFIRRREPVRPLSVNLMGELLAKLKKLRGRGLDEWRVRGAQFAAAGAERWGWSRQARVPSDAELGRLLDPSRLAASAREEFCAETLHAHFRARTQPLFFAAFRDAAATRAALDTRFKTEEAAVVARARRAGAGRFDLLGLNGLSFGSPPDWHLEPLSGRRTPLTHWSRINYLDPQVAGDKKVTWELNRHQYFATLGRAYWRTGDESFAETFAAHLSSWMDANPPKLGINWASSLEVAFRAISWLWALHFFRESPRLAPDVLMRALKFLYLHARHLETYLSTYFSPNTHLTGEALGLFYLGALLPEFKAAARWRATGEAVLRAQLARQVRADGVYFEQATCYQRYTADFYLHLAALKRAQGEGLDALLTGKLTALLDHLMYITRPDGTTPLVGDDDGGRLVMLDERRGDDFRAALSNGAALLGRADYKYVAGEPAEETLWLLGPEGLRDFERLDARPPAHASRAFADGGYYVMRDGWGRDSNYLLLDCGPHGALNCGHAHADALSFVLAARGRPLLVDPGTYTYTGSAALRDEFRSSAAHNTLTLDGESSSVPDGPFSWRHVARPAARRWRAGERFDFFEGEHDGYARLAPPATHSRGVLFLKGLYWVVRDRVEAEGARRVDIHFHFAADAAPLLEEGGPGDAPAVLEPDGEAAGLRILTFGAGGGWSRREGWVSDCYGARRPAPVWTFSATTEGGREFITFLVPRAAGQPLARVREVAAEGGRCFEMTVDGRLDVLLLGAGGRTVEAARLASDSEWAWARFAHDAGPPEEVLLVGGRSLSLDGREFVAAARRVGYLYARRDGDAWRVEADGGVEVTLAPAGAEEGWRGAEPVAAGG